MQVVLGDIMAHVDVRIGKGQIESVITRRSAEKLGLKKGDKVTAVLNPPKSCWKGLGSASPRLTSPSATRGSRIDSSVPRSILDYLRRGLHLLCVLMAVTPPALLGQWPDYLTPGVPKTADGKPIRRARAEGCGWSSRSFWSLAVPASAGNTRGQPEPGTARANDIIPLSVRTSQFWNLGASFKDGLPFQPWAAELHRQRAASNSIDNPDAHCLPLGVMQLHARPAQKDGAGAGRNPHHL